MPPSISGLPAQASLVSTGQTVPVSLRGAVSDGFKAVMQTAVSTGMAAGRDGPVLALSLAGGVVSVPAAPPDGGPAPGPLPGHQADRRAVAPAVLNSGKPDGPDMAADGGQQIPPRPVVAGLSVPAMPDQHTRPHGSGGIMAWPEDASSAATPVQAVPAPGWVPDAAAGLPAIPGSAWASIMMAAQPGADAAVAASRPSAAQDSGGADSAGPGAVLDSPAATKLAGAGPGGMGRLPGPETRLAADRLGGLVLPDALAARDGGGTAAARGGTGAGPSQQATPASATLPVVQVKVSVTPGPPGVAAAMPPPASAGIPPIGTRPIGTRPIGATALASQDPVGGSAAVAGADKAAARWVDEPAIAPPGSSSAPALPPNVLPAAAPAMALAPPSAAPAPVAPSSAADGSAAMVTQQLGPVLLSLAQSPDGSSQMTLQLHPTTLGQVSIQINRSIDGASVTVTADRPETARLMMEDAPGLQKALDAAGIPTAGRVVTFAVTGAGPVASLAGAGVVSVPLHAVAGHDVAPDAAVPAAHAAQAEFGEVGPGDRGGHEPASGQDSAGRGQAATDQPREGAAASGQSRGQGGQGGGPADSWAAWARRHLNTELI